MLTASGILGYLYSVYVPFRLPWNIDVALAAVVFYGAGNLFRKFTESETGQGPGSSCESSSRVGEGLFRRDNFLPGLLILVNLFYLGYLLKFPTADKVNMNVLKYGGFFSFYFFAFSGALAFVYLFKK
ncbi:MAG: hypothetical protein NHB15_05450 [Methanosarcina barkeri]|nr:hypothetical protein [Methanosarcina sp. ERenArc_MAG2]